MVEIAETEENEKQHTEKIRVGTQIIKQLSSAFYPNPLIIFDELVSNANDALAETVKIHIGRGWITIEDDGEGMTHEGLVHFFYISHTEKESVPVRSFKNVKRYIIGKFGIGKISLYQVCKDFEIVTWRDGIESSAVFDFEKFEKADFIDSFNLTVNSKKTDRKGHGTVINLFNLKGSVKEITLRDIKRRLERTMPLTENFKVLLSDSQIGPMEIKSENLDIRMAAKYDIKADVPDVGSVTGRVLFFKHEDQPSQGVFIRVLGRLVNSENTQGILNMNALNHPQMFANKIRVEVNADGLNDVLLTNRAGFMEKSEQYVSFRAWLQKYVRRLTDSEYDKWGEIRENLEKVELPQAISDAYSNIANVVPQSGISKYSEREEKARPQHKQKETKTRSRELPDLQTLIKKGKLKIEIQEMKLTDGEALFDKENGILIINSRSPSYGFAKTKMRLSGVVYHIFKSATVLIAYESARNLEEFKYIYDAISNNAELLRSIGMLLKRR